MSARDLILRQPLVYRLWMAPFAEGKFAPIAADTEMGRVRRVLDVGCGPGTNAPYFPAADYLGLDLNAGYIRDAERRFGASQGRRRFVTADAAKFAAPAGEQFDFVLVNSFLHHVDDAMAMKILSNLRNLLSPDGHVHILDLVLPESACVARFLARVDRGKFPRPLEKWRQMLAGAFEPVHFHPYKVGAFGATLWQMVYFKGRART